MDTQDVTARARARVNEIAPREALAAQAQGAVIVDVRDSAERAAGAPTGAVAISRGFLELKIGAAITDPTQPIMTLCGSGIRSLLAAETLLDMGYTQVSSITGGYKRWKDEGLPTADDAALDSDAAQRYARQLQLPHVGAAGQARLAAAKVVILGAGGLGAPAALYLAAAGVGTLTIIDDDRVERSNLHRQIIHADARVGMDKVASARMALNTLNPRIQVHPINTRLDASNVDACIAGHDIILDGADNFPARYLLSAASVRHAIPMIYGAVERFSGQISVFDPRSEQSPCYRCLFPEPPAPEEAPNCSEAGVLGVLPGLIGLMQATETLKLILGLGQPLVGRVLTLDALGMAFRHTTLPRDPACPGCGPDASHDYRDVEALFHSQ